MSSHEETTVNDTTERVRASLGKRYAAEKRFRLYGIMAIAASLGFLVVLLVSIISKGLPAFTQTFVKLTVELNAETLGVSATSTNADLRAANYSGLIKKTMRDRFPDVTKRGDKKKLYQLISTGAQYELADRLRANPSILGETITLWVPADDELDALVKFNPDLNQPDLVMVPRITDKQS